MTLSSMPGLKLCILMSPISVAQYLEPGYPLFNLIVFGEASQIPVWDAVGAMGRGTKGVVVGDPKHLGGNLTLAFMRDPLEYRRR